MSGKRSILKERSFTFALDVIEMYKMINKQHREYVMSKQMLRSGTSIGANIREAQNAQSNADFIHKLYIAQKECDETMYWLELLLRSRYIENKLFNHLSTQAQEILRMLKSAILTTKQKTHRQ